MRLKNWLRLSVVGGGILLGGMVFFTVYIGFLLDVKDFREGMMFGASYSLMLGGVLTAAISIGLYRSEVPLALSFGATRREVFFGLQLTRVIPMMVAVIVSYALAAGAGEAFSHQWRIFFLFGCGWLMFINALGVLLGVFVSDKGKIAVAIGAGILGVTAGIMAGLGATGAEWEFPPVVSAVALVVGVAMSVVALVVEKKNLHDLTVRL